MKRLLTLAIIGSILSQAAAPEIIERHEQRAEQIVPMEVDNAPIDAAVTITSAFKRPRPEERCIRKDKRPAAKRRRIQTAEEAQEMAPDIITLISSDNKKLYIPKSIAYLSPTLKDMLGLPHEESATGEINFDHFDHNELNLLDDILVSLSKNQNKFLDKQAEILIREGIINRHNLTTAQNLADFFELPAVHASLGLLFISNSGLAEATIKNKLSIKNYFEADVIDANFTGVSIQDLIDYKRIPKIELTRPGQRGTSYRLLDLHNKHINSLEGLENIPDINTVQTLNLSDNKLAALPDGIFDQLTQLIALKLDNNRLNTLPDGIFDQLTQLKTLELNKNQLATLPNSIFDQLTQLTVLKLENNNLAILPADIFNQLTQLRTLWFCSNQLTTLPDSIFDQLTQLTVLSLQNNRLTTLPNSIFDQLTELTKLSLAYNQLTALPDGIFDQLTQLKMLALNNNRLTTLPSLTHLNNLQDLELGNNPLSANTKEIIRQQFARLGQRLRI